MNSVVIFNLSDLHLDTAFETAQETIFNELIRDFSNYIKENNTWNPRYVIIAGDIINRGDTANYKFAKKLIINFCNKLKISGDHVIMAPGNHDKKELTIDSEEQYKTSKKTFSQFCSLPQNPESIKKDAQKKTLDTFLEEHKKGFEEYCKFYHDISFEHSKYPYHTYPLIGNTDIKLVTGLKMFDEDRICFLSLNTEWLYAADSILEKVPQKEIQFETGKNIVSYLHSKIKEICPDYTVITLMHRCPYEMSWFEINKQDGFTKSTLGSIEHCTDILVSGHDHSVYNQVPDMVKNKIQHFRLSTASWQQSQDDKIFPYSVTALRVDGVQEYVEVLKGNYSQPSNGNDSWWSFTSLKHKYPLRNKYEKIYKNNYNTPFKPRHIESIPVYDIYNEEDIKAKILQYFMYDEVSMNAANSPTVQIIDINNYQSDRVEELISIKTQNIKHVIFFFKKEHEDDDHLKENAIFTYEKIVDKHKDSRLLGEIVFHFVTVQMPQKWDKDER